MQTDLLVLGAGPAGLAVARAAAAKGLSVACVDGAPDAPWARSFGVWESEAHELGELAPIEVKWPSPCVDLGDRGRIMLGAAYCRLDVPELQRRLRESAARLGVRVFVGRAGRVDHDAESSRVCLDSGPTLEAEIVIDATGARSAWAQRGERREPAYQAAYGQLIEVDSHPYAEGEMSLMDYRAIPGELPLPTFLYALPLGRHRIFVEETSLAARPAVCGSVLSRRLTARLRAMGIVARRVVAEEHCVISMGDSLPVRDQRVLAFGAAAGMVHPATGYQLARALLLAPAVAAQLAGGGSRRARIRNAYDVIWPAARRRAWELYTFGMEALLRLDQDAIRTFFCAFFELKPEVWLPYLRGTATPSAISWAMLHVLARAEGEARWSLFRVGGPQSRALFRALSGAPS